MRMFVGMPLPPDLAAWLIRATSRLALHEEEFRRSRHEGWHITLQFLGNVAPPDYKCIASRLCEVPFESARIRISGIGWIGSGILAAEIEPLPELVQLAKNVTAATKALRV
jgi:2'-5' RNA ligase